MVKQDLLCTYDSLIGNLDEMLDKQHACATKIMMELLLESLILGLLLLRSPSLPPLCTPGMAVGWSGIVPACLSHYVTHKMIYLPSRYQHQVTHLHIPSV